MGKNYDAYVNSIQNEGTKKALKSAYKHIGDYEESGKTLDDVLIVFYLSKVDTPQSVRSLKTQFRNFAHYLGDEHLINMLDYINVYDVASKVKEMGISKYFSYLSFENAFNSINSSILNSYYVQTLFMCIYEGIYSRDFSVVKNLKARDISGNRITCRTDDGKEYYIEVSDELSKRLIELSSRHTWLCRNRFNVFEREISGLYYDSCFKVEKRERKNRKNPSEDVYVNTYRRLLREIVSHGLGYNVSAFDIYISGIMNRISNKLSVNNISLQKAFEKNNRDQRIKIIIEDELLKSNYTKSISQFKQLVEGHVDIYLQPSERLESNVRKYEEPTTDRIQNEEIQDYLEYKDLINSSEEINNVIYGKPMPKKEMIERNGGKVYPRDKKVALTALQISNYSCEVDEEHELFIGKRRNVPYTEPHHLVPLSFAEYFDVSLDVVENIVSLCSHCHNKIHYGKDITSMLKWLYENRRLKLEKAGIKITFDELLWMYKAKE